MGCVSLAVRCDDLIDDTSFVVCFMWLFHLFVQFPLDDTCMLRYMYDDVCGMSAISCVQFSVSWSMGGLSIDFVWSLTHYQIVSWKVILCRIVFLQIDSLGRTRY